MTLTETINGATMTAATEVNVNEITSDDLQYWGGVVFIPTTFVPGDQMEIRFYIWKSFAPAGLECLYYIPLVAETAPKERAIYLPPVQTKRYRLSFKRTAGTDHTFKWQITKQTG